MSRGRDHDAMSVRSRGGTDARSDTGKRQRNPLVSAALEACAPQATPEGQGVQSADCASAPAQQPVITIALGAWVTASTRAVPPSCPQGVAPRRDDVSKLVARTTTRI